MVLILSAGDCRLWCATLPDHSVDLIFTDPIYERVEDYVWLEQASKRLLKPGGNALAFVNAKWLSRVLRALETDLPVLSAVQNTSGGMNGRVIAKSYHLVWFGSGVVKRYVADGFIATPWSAPNQHNFKWTKNPKYLAHILQAFSDPSDVVLDPYMGGGSLGVMALKMGREYWGAEIDPTRLALGQAALQTVVDQGSLFT